ncbi:MAG: phosphoribosyltransferase family protein [Flavobacterium sp.]|uniref:phosphoribosyltransferase n=1 Tax=unclassified Flavobacterium TaxID=196869 RepID=UPI000C18F285|nr:MULTISPECIES: phosphoribosyltransferase family protein [unclassified Flavobacterium]MDP3679884.1 phosphoribosyltransferase family protein [Flavobacterium sp.]PIF63611.1 putative phosphoribosyltransferase [Flavobacterium sp. 11]
MFDEILKDRIEAGLLLSEKLKKYQNSNTIVLAVPRGGVPVGYVIAKNLHLPLDIVLSKKIGHPNNKEFAIGAVSSDSMILDEHPNIPRKYIDSEIIRLRQLMKHKYELYMGNRKPLDVKGKNIILVDDGIATGNTLLASINMLRKKNPAKIIVATPVIPYENVPVFEKNTDEFIYLIASKYFTGVGGFYEVFNQVEDNEVIELLRLPISTE